MSIEVIETSKFYSLYSSYLTFLVSFVCSYGSLSHLLIYVYFLPKSGHARVIYTPIPTIIIFMLIGFTYRF